MTRTKSTYLALLAILLSPFAANADLIGDTVNGSLGSDFGNLVTTPFDPTAVVGGGVEFTGVITDVFGQIWSIDLDIGASSFSVAISESTRDGDGNISDGPNLMDISIWNLDWLPGPGFITDVVLSSYSCASAGFSCETFGGGPDISVLDFGADFINFSANVMRDGELYEFDITATVPEPGTLALLGIGLLGMGAARRKKA